MVPQDTLRRHVHVYFAIETRLLPNFEEYCPDPPDYSSYKEHTAIAKKAEFLRKWKEEKAPELLHCLRVSRIEAVVFDFRDGEWDTMRACPKVADKPKRVSVSAKEVRGSVGVEFYRRLYDMLNEDEFGLSGVSGDRVSFRSRDGDFERHMLRVDMLRGARKKVEHIPSDLFLKLNSLSLRTVLGPEKYADIEVLMKQCRLVSDIEDQVMKDLQEVLNVFHAVHLCPRVDLRKEAIGAEQEIEPVTLDG